MERILEENYPLKKSKTIKCFEIRISDFHHVLRISIGKGKKFELSERPDYSDSSDR